MFFNVLYHPLQVGSCCYLCIVSGLWVNIHSKQSLIQQKYYTFTPSHDTPSICYCFFCYTTHMNKSKLNTCPMAKVFYQQFSNEHPINLLINHIVLIAKISLLNVSSVANRKSQEYPAIYSVKYLFFSNVYLAGIFTEQNR